MHINNWRIISLVFLSLAGVCILMAAYSFRTAIYNQVKIDDSHANSATTPRDFERQMKSLGNNMDARFDAILGEWRGLSYSVLCAFFMLVAIGCEALAQMDNAAKRLSNAISQHQWHPPQLQRDLEPDPNQLQEQVAVLEYLVPTPTSPASINIASSGKVKARCGACGRVIVGGADWSGRTGDCPQCNSPVQFP